MRSRVRTWWTELTRLSRVGQVTLWFVLLLNIAAIVELGLFEAFNLFIVTVAAILVLMLAFIAITIFLGLRGLYDRGVVRRWQREGRDIDDGQEIGRSHDQTGFIRLED